MRPLHADIPPLRWAVLALLPDLIKIKSHVLLAWREKHHTVSFLSRLEVVFHCLLHRNKLALRAPLCVCVCVCVCVCGVCESGYSKPLPKEILEYHHLQA